MLQSSLTFIAIMLERILPTVTLVMPDKAPLVICLWSGCNGLALRIPYGLAHRQVP